MQVELRYLHTPDVVDDLSVYAPQENDNFSILIEMVVGPKGKDGEEVFDFILCTPKWLMNKHGKEDIIWGRHYIIVFEYNYLRLHKKLTEYVSSIEEDTWDRITDKLSRIAHSEFEDYKPYRGS